MVLATLLLLCAMPQGDDAKVAGASNANADRQVLSAALSDSASKDSTGTAVLPSAPEPKVKPAVEPAPLRSAAAQPFLPVRPRAVETGAGQEANPFLKPFANSTAIYAATQVSPAVMDYLGKRMMVSQNPALRKLWWIPQLMGSGMSFAAGAHNMGVVH